MIFSAFSSTPDFDASPYRREYTDYRIFSADGKRLIQAVHNDNAKLMEGPRKVLLPVGSYRVVARANGYGPLAVPVAIRPNEVTAVHLEGSVWWPRSSGIADSNPVRLPGGEIAGWRASAAAP